MLYKHHMLVQAWYTKTLHCRILRFTSSVHHATVQVRQYMCLSRLGPICKAGCGYTCQGQRSTQTSHGRQAGFLSNLRKSGNGVPQSGPAFQFFSNPLAGQEEPRQVAPSSNSPATALQGPTKTSCSPMVVIVAGGGCRAGADLQVKRG